jgi:transcriptional regulator with XRE-family HTH domain
MLLRVAPAAQAFGRRIRKLRGQLTQGELALRAGISRGFLARLERGLQDPTLTTIEKLAKALHIQAGQLFADAPGAGRRRKRRRKP